MRTVAEVRRHLWGLAILTVIFLFILDLTIPLSWILPIVLMIISIFYAVKFLRCPFCGRHISLVYRPCCPHCGKQIDP